MKKEFLVSIDTEWLMPEDWLPHPDDIKRLVLALSPWRDVSLRPFEPVTATEVQTVTAGEVFRFVRRKKKRA